MYHTDSINNVMANISVLLPLDMVNPSTINIDSNETILYRTGIVGMIPVVSVPGGVTIKFIRIMAQVCGGPGPDINGNIK